MSTSRIAPWATAILAILVFASSAQAQLFRPFHVPGITNDFQFFAPTDIGSLGGGPSHKTGWFATYDRAYINVSRPDNSAPFGSPTVGDFGWGNRFDIGFVDATSRGWKSTIWHLDGPNANEVQITERINRFNPNGAPQMPSDNPPADNNNRITEARHYILLDSVNVIDMSGVEFNRTWLQRPLYRGASLEPYAGVRYVKFVDFNRRDNYQRFDVNGVPIPPSAEATAIQEVFTSQRSGFTNEMLGGQIGLRLNQFYGNWQFSTDVKFFGMQNFQNWEQENLRIFTLYTGALAVGDTVRTERLSKTFASDNGNEFVWGGELRAEAAYEVSRDVALRFGLNIQHFGQGVGRGGANPNANSEDVFMAGVTFGVTANR